MTNCRVKIWIPHFIGLIYLTMLQQLPWHNMLNDIFESTNINYNRKYLSYMVLKRSDHYQYALCLRWCYRTIFVQLIFTNSQAVHSAKYAHSLWSFGLEPCQILVNSSHIFPDYFTSIKIIIRFPLYQTSDNGKSVTWITGPNNMEYWKTHVLNWVSPNLNLIVKFDLLFSQIMYAKLSVSHTI